jgi:branched-chain amino acid transport system substrate-binding protein
MSVEQLAIREEKMRRAALWGWALALGAVGALGLAGTAAAQEKKVLIGVQCDRTDPTQIVGTVICPAYQDYFNYINSQGGIEGYKIETPEIDNSYKVPPAVEAYERHKQQGAVTMSVYGTPQI